MDTQQPFIGKEGQQGFTLTELMVSSTVFILCVTMAMGSFIAAYRLMFFTRMLDISQTEVRTAVDIISNHQREALYLPMIYSNGVPSPHLAPEHLTNLYMSGSSVATNIVPNPYRSTVGNEVRIMNRGNTYSLAADLQPGQSQLQVSNNAISSVSPVRSVFATVPANQTDINPALIRTYEAEIAPSNNQSVLLVSGNVLLPKITAVAEASPGIYQITLAEPWGGDQTAPKGALVFIGAMARFVATNNQLVYFQDSGTSQGKTILTNLSYKNDNDIYSAFGSYGGLLTIDLQYTSPGDVSGKGIYRIITRTMMRTDPTAKLGGTYLGKGGINGAGED